MDDLVESTQLEGQSIFSSLRANSLGTLCGQHNKYGDVHASGNARVQVGNSYTFNSFGQKLDTVQNLLACLNFPQMNDRRAQISASCPDTYHWIFSRAKHDVAKWDCFISWLYTKQSNQKTYWISGKPGSGKSTLMKFLDTSLVHGGHLARSFEGGNVVLLQHYFWSSGNQMQKSTEGLFRHLIIQVLKGYPGSPGHIASAIHGMTAGAPMTSWNISNLADIFENILVLQQAHTKFLLLIDGLDECEDYDALGFDLLLRLFRISTLDNVKICISSRPWNVFKDAFLQYPQLKLEDLTNLDMHTFVASRLDSSPRWLLLRATDHKQASRFIENVVAKAEGVFLWTALVLRDILEDLSDGEDLTQLAQRLDDMPTDLERYFKRILDSVKEPHRTEAALLFQLAAWTEDRYITLTPFRLVDIMFLEISSQNMKLDSKCQTFASWLRTQHSIDTLMDSLARKLNSRTRGLLECFNGGEICSLTRRISHRSLNLDSFVNYEEDDGDTSAEPFDRIDRVFSTQIKPIHRSLRDFLLNAGTQTSLQQHTNGRPIDVRSWFIEARLIRLLVLDLLSYKGEYVAGLVSYLMCSMSVNGRDDRFVNVLPTIAPIVERFAKDSQAERHWYTSSTYECYNQEKGNFLSIAIDFRLTAYVVERMTWRDITSKRGRPLLDHILRSRYGLDDLGVFDQHPDITILNATLRLGANPNTQARDTGPSLWALYLCYFVDSMHPVHERWLNRMHTCLPWLEAIHLLIQHGASLVLPLHWLCIESDLDELSWESTVWTFPPQLDIEIFRARWGSLPLWHVTDHQEQDWLVCVASDILASLAHLFPCDLEPFLQDLKRRETTTLRSLNAQPFIFPLNWEDGETSGHENAVYDQTT